MDDNAKRTLKEERHKRTLAPEMRGGGEASARQVERLAADGSTQVSYAQSSAEDLREQGG